MFNQLKTLFFVLVPLFVQSAQGMNQNEKNLYYQSVLTTVQQINPEHSKILSELGSNELLMRYLFASTSERTRIMEKAKASLEQKNQQTQLTSLTLTPTQATMQQVQDQQPMEDIKLPDVLKLPDGRELPIEAFENEGAITHKCSMCTHQIPLQTTIPDEKREDSTSPKVKQDLKN